MFDTLSTDWQGKTVILIGGGPSLRTFNFMKLLPLRKAGALVIAINDAMRRCPWADVAFSIDRLWLSKRRYMLNQFKGEKVAIADASCAKFRPGVRYILRDPSPRLSDDMAVVCTGENSGFAALGMSMMRGATKIYMLGYDMTGPGHFHAGYEWNCPHGVADYPRWAGHFDALAVEAEERGVSVINCNSDSAVKCFPFGSIE